MAEVPDSVCHSEIEWFAPVFPLVPTVAVWVVSYVANA